MRTKFGAGLEEFLALIHADREKSPQAFGQRFTLPTKTDHRRHVRAEVDDERLIVKCPFCLGAEMVDAEDLRFFCLSCFNAEADGHMIPILLPDGLEL